MPLPWKKANKAKAISKFVVDRIQSSKHGGASGGSLVVETGFPTSIVDLFVKNRDRLKKPPSSSSSSKKDKKRISKTSHNPNPDLIPILDSSSSASPSGGGDVGVAVDDVPPPSTPPLLVSPPDSRTPTNFRLLPPPVPASSAAIPVRGGGDQVGRSGNCGGAGDQIDSTMVFMAMLKMFLVVVLALATTKFVVGITMSAFLLLLMEYAGKHYCRFFKTHPSLCFDKYSLKCFIERALCLLGINNKNKNQPFPDEDDDDDGDFKAPLLQQQQEEELLLITREEVVQIGHSHEIEVAATSSSTSHHHHPPRPPRRIHCVASESDLLSAELNWGNKQVEERNQLVLDKEAAAYASCDGLESSDLKKRASRRLRIKSKIKRLMSSNLHGSKKKRINHESSGNKACSSSGEDDNMLVNTMSCSRMDIVEANQLCGMEGTDDCLVSSSTSENGICFSNEISRADTEDETSIPPRKEEERAKSKTEGNSGYLVFFATVLVGLVGGKSLAIAFTLTCCLLLKSYGILKVRRMKCVAGDASTS